jgi:hypothetical protein
LSVRQTPIVKNLQEERDELAGSLLYLIDKNDRIGFPADIFGKLATRVVSNVSRSEVEAGKSANGMRAWKDDRKRTELR